jgi:hypothetical protein
VQYKFDIKYLHFSPIEEEALEAQRNRVYRIMRYSYVFYLTKSSVHLVGDGAVAPGTDLHVDHDDEACSHQHEHLFYLQQEPDKTQ